MSTPPQAENLALDEDAQTPALKAAETARGLINDQIQVEDVSGSKKPVPENVKTAYPLFGNFLFSATGPFIDRKKAEDLKKDYPELFKVMMDKRADILKLLGIRNLSELKNRSMDEGFVKQIREKVALSMADKLVSKELRSELSEKGLLRLSDKELRELGWEADTLVKYVIDKFFPNTGGNPPSGLLNEVENQQDVGKLILMVADEENYDEKARFEALRKLALIEVLVKLNKFEEDREEQHMGLSYLDDIFNKEGIYSRKDGKKIGHHDIRYLITGKGRKGDYLSLSLMEDGKEAKALLDRDPAINSTPIAMRAFEVEDENGNAIEIESMLDTRVKTRINMALKMLRRDTVDPNDMLKDLNGVRMVFRSEREINLFERSLMKKLKANGHNVDIKREKDEVGKGKLKFRKTNLEIDGRSYEFQIFTFDEFANYLYKEPYSWTEYEIRRFFESSSSQALFPSDIYKNLDREAAEKQATKQARANATGRMWGMDNMQDQPPASPA